MMTPWSCKNNIGMDEIKSVFVSQLNIYDEAFLRK